MYKIIFVLITLLMSLCNIAIAQDTNLWDCEKEFRPNRGSKYTKIAIDGGPLISSPRSEWGKFQDGYEFLTNVDKREIHKIEVSFRSHEKDFNFEMEFIKKLEVICRRKTRKGELIYTITLLLTQGEGFNPGKNLVKLWRSDEKKLSDDLPRVIYLSPKFYKIYQSHF